MQGTKSRSVIIQRVLPAERELAGLALAVSNVLAEIDAFLRRNIQSDGFSQVLKRQLAVLVRVKPIEERPHLIIRGNETPRGQKLLKPIILHVVVGWHPPLVKDTLDCRILAESSLDELLLQVAASHLLADTLLVRLVLFNTLSEVDFELWVLFGVVAEEERFCRLDSTAEPSAEVVVVDAGFQALRMQLD